MKIRVKKKRFVSEMTKRFLSQKDLAEKLEMTPQAVNAILKERNGTSLETAKKICDLFVVSFDDLFTVDELPFAEE